VLNHELQARIYAVHGIFIPFYRCHVLLLTWF
jgi:hypothetical protein